VLLFQGFLTLKAVFLGQGIKEICQNFLQSVEKEPKSFIIERSWKGSNNLIIFLSIKSN
jgi:hypothetical protein